MYEIMQAPKVNEDYAEVYIIGDCHYGIGEEQDRKLLQRVLKDVVSKNADAINNGKSPYCFVAGVGDTLDLSIKGKFGVIGKDQATNEAIRAFKQDFFEVATKGYYLGTVPGNHDVRITNTIGSNIDLVEEWFLDLEATKGVKIGYGCPHLILDFKVGNSSFIGFITHGSGSGGQAGSVANSMFKSVNELNDADFYCQGHFHRDIYVPRFRAYYNKGIKAISTQAQHFFTVSSLLKKNGYAAIARFEHAGTSILKIKLHAANKNTHYHTPKRLEFDLIWGDVTGLKSRVKLHRKEEY